MSSLSSALLTNGPAVKIPGLMISPDGRGLCTDAGVPFFYLGDTAWELIQRLPANSMRQYLRDRAAKGFNVVQTSLIPPLGGHTTPNREGHRIFQGDDPLQPNEGYFAHVDEVTATAGEMGLYLAVNPIWGGHILRSREEGGESGPFTVGSARAFGAFLGRRYREAPVIWMLGGGCSAAGLENIWNALAKGLRAGGGGNQLITFLPREYMSSSRRWHQVEWLDFNSIRSGDKRKFNNNYDLIEHDWHNEPPKPTLDACLCTDHAYVAGNPQNGLFDAYDVRVAAYRSVLAGGCGIGYSCGPLWQMWDAGENEGQPSKCPPANWHEVLNRPAAHQLRYLKNLISSRSAHHRFRDDSLLLYNGNPWEQKFAARHAASLPIASRDGTRGKPDASFIMVYFPSTPGDIELRVDSIIDEYLRVYWFDPQTGVAYEEPLFKNTGVYAPEWDNWPWRTRESNGPDWLLIIESTDIAYPRPQG